MTNLHEKHMELIDAINNAVTQDEHRAAELRRHAWIEGVRDAGRDVDLIRADLEQFARGNEARPMCCGVFLDWEPPAARNRAGEEGRS